MLHLVVLGISGGLLMGSMSAKTLNSEVPRKGEDSLLQAATKQSLRGNLPPSALPGSSGFKAQRP